MLGFRGGLPRVSSGGLDRAAWLLTNLFMPPVVTAALVLVVVGEEVPLAEGGLSWALLFLLPVVVLPSLWIIYLAFSGRAQDIHLPKRSNRLMPLALTTLASLATVLALFALRAPVLLQRLALVSLTQLAVCLGVTASWKISMHSATASTAAVVLSGMQPALMAPLWLTALAVAWSRLRLRRHTPMQVAAGGALGFLTCSLLFL